MNIFNSPHTLHHIFMAFLLMRKTKKKKKKKEKKKEKWKKRKEKRKDGVDKIVLVLSAARKWNVIEYDVKFRASVRLTDRKIFKVSPLF